MSGNTPLSDEYQDVGGIVNEDSTYYLFCANEERSFINHAKYDVEIEEELVTITLSNNYVSEIFNYEHMITFVPRSVAQQCHDQILSLLPITINQQDLAIKTGD